MKLFSFLTNPIFWRVYKRNLIAAVALFLIALFGFNVFIGNDPLGRGPSTALAVEAGYCESGYTFNGGDAGDDANWTYTNCGSGGSSSSNAGSWKYLYPECDWSSNKVYEVYQHSGTGEYDRRDYHYQDGACGYSKSSTSSSSSSSNSGEWRFVYPECDWNSKQVYDIYWHSGTGAYDRRSPHYQEGACGYNKEWEGAGCNGNHSVWGVWSKQGGNLLRVERDYGVVPGECNNSRTTPTPYPTQTPQRTYQDRYECDGRRYAVKRYWSDNRTEIVTNYGEYPGYCGVSTYTQPTYQQSAPVYQAPAPVAAPQQAVIGQIQGSCISNTTQITRGGSVTYTAYISTGGTGRLGRVDFSGERAQSGPGTFTVQYNTSGPKYMNAMVSDADPRGGSQAVQCPSVNVTEPVQQVAAYVPPTYQQPVYQQPTYQQPPVVYQQPQVYSAPAPAPTVVYAQQPTVVAPSQPMNYCPAGGQQIQVSGNVVYCSVVTSQTTQTIEYVFSGTQIISQRVVPIGMPLTPNTTAPVPTQQVVIPTATPVSPTTGTTIQCPSGYSAQAYGTTVYCVQTTSTQQQANVVTAANNQKQGTVVFADGPVATAAATQPKVLTTAGTSPSVTELPRTGLPLAAWGISALLPLGLKMRKNKKSDQESSVNSIWMTRQLNKD